nr:heparan-alpha-glucosaminide N-acetyltransferase domain-containing protein [Corynebacterium antarcticum]
MRRSRGSNRRRTIVSQVSAVTQSVPVPGGGSGSRVAGIDVARALAIFGMMFAHIGAAADSPAGDAAHLLATGLPSSLFAVLAGVSLGFMGSAGAAAGGERLAASRSRLYVRGMLVVAIGLGLTYVQSVIAVVLMAIGIEIILLAPAVRWRTRTLLIWWAVLFLAGAAVTTLLRLGGFYSVLITLGYPLPAWLLYGITGILLHRHLIHSGPRAWTVAAVTGAVVAGAGVWWWRLDVLDIGHDSPHFDFHDPDHEVARELFLSAAPHSGGLGDVVVSVGASVATVGLCLLACRVRWVGVLLYPLRATGSMALTVYVAHVLTATMLTGFSLMALFGHWAPSHGAPLPETGSGFDPDGFAVTALAALLLTSLWRWRFRRGPLEGLLRWIIGKATRTDLPPRVTPASP